MKPFEYVIAEHGRAVLGFCASRVGAERAEDCFQETMLAALAAYDRLEDEAAVKTWLFTIASRKAVDMHRDRARRPLPSDEVETLAGGSGGPDPTDREVWTAVADLPEKQRAAVTLRYRADLTHREIATVMEISEEAARRNVFEGLKRLRALEVEWR